MKPISPQDIAATKEAILPDDVIDEWNKIIAEQFSGGSAEIEQSEIVARIAKRMKVPREHVFKRGWVDIEELYRKAGWRVEYDKPGYNETYEATFTFRKKR